MVGSIAMVLGGYLAARTGEIIEVPEWKKEEVANRTESMPLPI